MGGTSGNIGKSIAIDSYGNVYSIGNFYGTVDFNPGPGTFNLHSTAGSDIFISKIDASGNFIWAKSMGGYGDDYGEYIALDASGNVYTAGFFYVTVDFDPGEGTFNLTSSGLSDIFIQKLSQQGIIGKTHLDLNGNCILDTNESGLSNKKAIINPGNILVETNDVGIWHLDSLPAGNYTITYDTSGNWSPTCINPQSFTVVDPMTITTVTSFGFVSTQPCPAPNVSISMPRMRPGFSNQNIYVNACNEASATGALNSAYADVKLDGFLTVQSATKTYTALGNNTYRFQLDNLNPGQCISFSIACSLSVDAVLGSTLCMQANLFPADACVFDSIPEVPAGVSPCTLPWDKSSLKVEGTCVNDSIRFTIYNTGDSADGDMDCFSPVRLYIDGQFILLDSVKLNGGDSAVFNFAGDGRTWRLEADQHPEHPGNSHPNATLELCGNANNWTPNLVNLLPQDDADPVVDIFLRGGYRKL